MVVLINNFPRSENYTIFIRKCTKINAEFIQVLKTDLIKSTSFLMKITTSFILITIFECINQIPLGTDVILSTKLRLSTVIRSICTFGSRKNCVRHD